MVEFRNMNLKRVTNGWIISNSMGKQSIHTTWKSVIDELKLELNPQDEE